MKKQTDMSEVRLRRLGIQLMILAAAILAVCLVYRISRGDSFIDRIPIVQDGKDPGAYKMAFEDLLYIINTDNTSQEIETYLSKTLEGWKKDTGDKFKNIENLLNNEIAKARKKN